ncbi:MAG: endolytic transglycosylase MltG [Deltaproteobacteria bacterium]|nr:endolytic transglycosylase MltG [Deltaproteobacteria bacterium]MBW1717935.1 endolytic transglycosylase MltG [Deltaproteobacteria bacterium]MBW1931626.1 endolytic transglycosylase MltG [Deltaproteobacteria bacterium]MBW1937449.1 endolytic transglycosylase MltG [Deltaproteobacteria bacterium]MBW1964194.1 endolytic transglycosylase MltG [Deltaproteobacteria bacterium]
MRIIREFWLPVLLYLVFLSGYQIWKECTLPVSETGRSKIVLIPTGSSFSSATQQLETEGLIKSKKAFYCLAWLKDATTKIKAGEYELSPTQTPAEILDYLVHGKIRQYIVTIPEGYNLFQIDNLLANAKLISKDSFLNVARDKNILRTLGIKADSAEGYVYPDTYQLTKDATAYEMLRTFVNHFWEVWNSAKFSRRTEKLGVKIHDIVTIASIVEKEAMRSRERPLIACVFWNRLKKNMPLQADPTVHYGILVETKAKKRRLRWKDLRKNTPYNTYVNRGLPNGPISNPGKESIRATLYPSKKNYFYFVSKNNGTHCFSQTLAEHNRAVNKYQRRRKYRPRKKTNPDSTQTNTPL